MSETLAHTTKPDARSEKIFNVTKVERSGNYKSSQENRLKRFQRKLA